MNTESGSPDQYLYQEVTTYGLDGSRTVQRTYRNRVSDDSPYQRQGPIITELDTQYPPHYDNQYMQGAQNENGHGGQQPTHAYETYTDLNERQHTQRRQPNYNDNCPPHNWRYRSGQRHGADDSPVMQNRSYRHPDDVHRNTSPNRQYPQSHQQGRQFRQPSNVRSRHHEWHSSFNNDYHDRDRQCNNHSYDNDREYNYHDVGQYRSTSRGNRQPQRQGAFVTDDHQYDGTYRPTLNERMGHQQRPMRNDARGQQHEYTDRFRSRQRSDPESGAQRVQQHNETQQMYVGENAEPQLETDQHESVALVVYQGNAHDRGTVPQTGAPSRTAPADDAPSTSNQGQSRPSKPYRQYTGPQSRALTREERQRFRSGDRPCHHVPGDVAQDEDFHVINNFDSEGRDIRSDENSVTFIKKLRKGGYKRVTLSYGMYEQQFKDKYGDVSVACNAKCSALQKQIFDNMKAARGGVYRRDDPCPFCGQDHLMKTCHRLTIFLNNARVKAMLDYYLYTAPIQDRQKIQFLMQWDRSNQDAWVSEPGDVNYNDQQLLYR